MRKMIASTVPLILALASFFTYGMPGKAHAQLGTASKSWCLGLKHQWQVRYDRFGRDDEALRAAFEEHNCAAWGVTLPGTTSAPTPPPSSPPPWGTASKSWCLGLKHQWQVRYDRFGRDDEALRAAFEEHNCAYWGIRVP